MNTIPSSLIKPAIAALVLCVEVPVIRFMVERERARLERLRLWARGESEVAS